jgi:O-antigen ligase
VNLFLGATTLATFSGLLAIIIDFNILKMKKPCHPFRACGTYGMTITYGYGIALALILFVVLFYQRKKLANYFNQYLLYASLFFNSLGLYFSYARGGLIGFFIGACSILFFINKKIFALMMVITLSGIVTLVFLSKHPTFSSRLLVPWEQPTNLLRIHQSQAALSASVEHTWWGLGFRNFEGQSIELKKKYGVPFIPGYENWKGHAHNNYLETLVGCGYMAFIFFCLWHVGWLIKTFQTKGALFYFGPFVVVHMVIGLFQSTIIDGENMFLIMGIFAISEAISRTQSRVVDL